jgi:chromosome partitioning protein
MDTIAHIIAVSNRKGGTGKSTVAVNLAAELAALGYRVLLVDLDTQGHCAVGLGIKSLPQALTIHKLFTDKQISLVDIILETAVPRLSIAPADQLFEHGSGERDTLRLNRALATPEVVSRFDVVIIDTPPSFDILLLNALVAANWVLVPYIPHQLSYEGIKQLMRVLFKVISTENPSLKILGFLPMMAMEHIRQHRNITGEVARQFGALRVMPGIRSDIRLAEAFSVGRPIRAYAPRCRGAEDFSALASLVVIMLKII